MNNPYEDYDYQIPLERFKELLADDGMVEDGSITHTIESVATELTGPMFIDRFAKLVRSVLDDYPMNVRSPDRVAEQFVTLVNEAADFYHKEEVH